MSGTVVWRRARGLGLLLLAWLCFCSLQSAIWVTLTPGRPVISGYLVLLTVVLALCWAAISLLVAQLHQRIRTRTASLPAIALLHLPLFLVAVLAAFGSFQLVEVLRGSGVRLLFWANIMWTLDQDLACYVLIVAVAEMLSARRTLRRREQRNRRLESLVGRARLDFLEAQLQPHFLFNALSAVAEHASTEPALAGRVIDQLIAGLRLPDGERRDEVTLERELAELDGYLDIQRMRFADWLAISFAIAPEARGCLVPRFVLQPLVENAIRHGLAGRTTRGAIEISAAIEGGALVVRIADNGVGLREGASHGNGIGLANVRQRLDILYGDAASVRLLTSSGAGTTAELGIPARRAGGGAEGGVAAVEADAGAEARDVTMPALLRHPAFAIPAVWAVCGLFWTQQAWLYIKTGQQLSVTTWLGLARHDFIVAGLWAALTPLVLLAGGRWIERIRASGWQIAAGAAACAGAMAAHVLLYRWLINPGEPLLSPWFQGVAAVDFIIAVLVMAIARRGALVRWLRRSDAEAAALEAELAGERRRAERVQAFPRVLVGSLEIIRATVRQDAARAEQQITLLGDYLRAALESTAAEDAVAAHDTRLAAAVAALRGGGALAEAAGA